MCSMLLLVTLLIVAGLESASVQLQFDLGTPAIQRTINLNETILQNSDIKITLKCRATYPTEWILNSDQDNAEQTRRIEWTDRYFKNSIQETQCDCIALIYLEIPKFSTNQSYRCQGVGNEQDSFLVQFIPDNAQVKVLTRSGSASSKNRSSSTPVPSCEIQFTIMYVRNNGYFARCSDAEGQNQIGTTRNHDCFFSAAYCASLYRNVKAYKNTCTNVIHGSNDLLLEVGWERLGGNSKVKILLPGTVVCTLGNIRGAQEYFFTRPNSTTGIQDIHFSWTEIQPEDMVWTMPETFESVYYLGQAFQLECTVPKYGFSFGSALRVKINGTTLHYGMTGGQNLKEDDLDEIPTYRTWKQSFEIKFGEIGFYEIMCVAPVWNTTEWAIRKIEFIVKESVLPSFEKPMEHITLSEGEGQKEIYCIAHGDPQPQVEWIVQSGFHPIRANGEVLSFLSITPLLEGEYKCKATNFLGNSAIKTVSVSVLRKPVEYATGNSGSNTTGISIGVSLGILFILLFVFVFFNQKFRKLNDLVTGLSVKEIVEFREGKKTTRDNLTCPEFIESLSYNSSFELDRNDFQVDKSRPLGSGVYGIVYKGTVRTERGIVDVAFKTVKKEADISYLKALLSELKILIHIGNHNSIVSLIGAWTENIQNREVLVAVELCDVCMLNFLRNNSLGFRNYVRNGAVSMEQNPYTTICTAKVYYSLKNPKSFSTANLIQWAEEIATALEYITSKNIIHGDIAARNILLTNELKSKLCDFGLARQLIDYNYIKSSECPLPWKWLAIESLRHMVFSTKSDVWAYGITLWEIFSLGEVPYPGLGWSEGFIRDLESGMRNTQPPKAQNEIWKVISQCWDQIPENRPSFTQLKDFFQSLQTAVDLEYTTVTP